jgi:hypothetical protein
MSSGPSSFAAAAPLPRSQRGGTGSLRLRGATPIATGGLIAIGGPPLGGKSVLAARLAECIPHCIRLEAIDDLSRAQPFLSRGGSRRVVRDPTADLLQDARRLLRQRTPGPARTILIVTRFATAAERRRAKVAARLAGVRFLFVEARSRDARALRRIPSAFVTRVELTKRLARYQKAVREYRPIERAEALILPALRLQRVQSNFDAAVDEVLGAWSGF